MSNIDLEGLLPPLRLLL